MKTFQNKENIIFTYLKGPLCAQETKKNRERETYPRKTIRIQGIQAVRSSYLPMEGELGKTGIKLFKGSNNNKNKAILWQHFEEIEGKKVQVKYFIITILPQV